MKLAVGLVVSLFAIGSVSLLYTAYKDNKSLDRSLISARRRADSLDRLGDSIAQRAGALKTKVDSALAEANELKKSVAQAHASLNAKDKSIARSLQAVDTAKKKIEQLLASKKADANLLKELQSKNDQLEKEKKDLEARMIVMTESNDKLNNALFKVKDNILVETFSRSGKLNVKGKRVNKISATLAVPFELKHPIFKFFDPNGNLVPERNGSFNFHAVKDANSPFAGGYQSTKVELSYSLSQKLSRGTYKIEMLDGDRHIGNLMVSFR
jgi:hypothetical protein